MPVSISDVTWAACGSCGEEKAVKISMLEYASHSKRCLLHKMKCAGGRCENRTTVIWNEALQNPTVFTTRNVVNMTSKRECQHF